MAEIEPREFGVDQDVRMTPIPDEVMPEGIEQDADWSTAIAATIDAGVAALQGRGGPTYDAIVYTVAIILNHLGRVKSMGHGARLVRKVLDSGHALNRLC